MISNSFLSRGYAFLNTPNSTGQDAKVNTSVFIAGEYFISDVVPAAKSEIDYFVSPLEQIQSQLNRWLSQFGSKTCIETEDAKLLIAPRAEIPQDYFDSYEPVFRTVMLYRADVANWQNDSIEGPSEEQRNAALLGIANLILALLPAPSPMFLEDGTIGAYWRRGKHYASIDFEVDGEHTWAGTDGTNYHSGTWKVPGELFPPAKFPPELANNLLSIGS